MSEQACSRCGKAIPSDAPAGDRCPHCLLGAGLESTQAARTMAGRGAGRLPLPSPEELGPRFPQLEIFELIGRGGMGAVYKARQIHLDRLVALTILTIEAAESAGFAERFTREARALARLSHPHIVGVHDFGEAEGLYYLLMEFVDGANLREVMTAGAMSVQEALAVVPQVCDALQFAHEQGVVHRDIKPENILLDGKGVVKIADFGLAKMVDPEGFDRTLTVPGQVMGTPTYMAPEQIERPSEVDHRADIFSLGVVFYEMLTGELPLGRFQPPSRKVVVDVRLDEVVLRTLEKEPERRYQRASEMREAVTALDTVAVVSSPGSSSPGTASPGGGPDAGAAASAPAPPPPPTATPVPRADTPVSPTTMPGRRTIEVRRSHGLTWVAIWSFTMAVLYAVPSSPLFEVGFGPLSIFGSGGGMWGLGRFLIHMTGWCLAAAHVFAGVGVLRLREWSRPLALVLAGLGAVTLPVGTVLSIWPLIYLLRKDVARLFELGEGPADLADLEASRIEDLMNRPRRGRGRRRKSRREAHSERAR